MEQTKKFRLTGMERAWILYDVGNSAFVLMVATLIPIFFTKNTSNILLKIHPKG